MKKLKKGTFREDLYYRLNVFPLATSHLVNRKSDIIPLTTALLYRHCKSVDELPWLNRSALETLLDHNWPGNVRELRNLVERISILSQNENKSNITRLLNEILNKNSTQNLNETTTSMSYPLKQARENFEKKLSFKSIEKEQR